MKKIIQKEVQFCDQCGKETYCGACLCCGIEHCYECREIHGVEYPHAIYFSGSGNGYYCKSCNAKLAKQNSDVLYNAYLAIAVLRREAERWSLDFKARSDKAESNLKQLSDT